MRHSLNQRIAIFCHALLVALTLTASPASAAVSSAGDVTPTPPAGGGAIVGPFTIGDTGAGAVDVAGGTAITNSSTAIVGDESTGIGIVTLDGLGSDWTLTTGGADLFVGDAGTGSLSVVNGAKLTVNDDTFLGVSSTAMGEVIVADLGSVWDNGDDMTIGQSGLAIIDVFDGGQVHAQSVTLGSNITGEGRVTVSGLLSRWQLTSSITIGGSGLGNLQVLDGGRVFSAISAILGESALSVGVAEVSGAGSFWEIAGATITVGSLGTGTVRVLNGGRITAATSVTIASGAASRGEIVVDGTNSRLAITGSLNTSAGDGNVTLANGGVLSTTTPSTITTTGRFTLDGGRFESIAAGSSVITVQGLLQGSGTLDIAGVTLNLSGATRGRLHTTAGDHLLLTGSLTNTGVVDLEGGELEVRSTFTNNFDVDLRNGATLRVGSTGLDNNPNAQIAITSGNVDVFGAVDNNLSAEIAVVGGATAVFHDALTNNGTIFVSPGSEIVLLEDLNFAGTAALSVALAAIEPGDDPTDAFGQATTTGQATLDGTLNVSLAGGFVPALGHTYQILTAAGGRSNTFDVESLPALAGNLALDVLYTPTAVTLAVVPALDGDYNADGTVNAADYTVWRDTLGQTALGLAADGNADGTVNTADYTLWKTNFGATLGSGGASSAPVPEPASWLLLFGTLTLCLSGRASAPRPTPA